MPIRNLWLLYIIKLSKWFMLYMPISYLFYMENSFSEIEYLSLHAVYSGVIAFFEIPSGYIADVWGRKTAIIGGLIFGVLGFSVYSISGGLVFFLIAEILLGVGQSLISGADSALLYDSLLEKKQEKKYIKHEGGISALGNFAEVSAAIFVSIVVLGSYRYYFYLQTIITVFGLICSIFLVEPKIHGQKLAGNFKDIINVIKHIFLGNPKLRNLILYSSIIGFASLSMAWLTQPILAYIGIKESNFGYTWAFLNFLVVLGSLSASKIVNRFSFLGSLVFMGIPLSILYFIVGWKLSMMALFPLSIFYFIRGTAHPILKKYINDLTTSEKRATVLSVRSLVIRILFLLMGPILGIISEKISLQLGVIICGIIILIPAILLFIILYRGSKL